MQKGASEQLNEGSLLDKWLNRKDDENRSEAINVRPDGAFAPLSLGQKRLLFLQQLYPENPFYNYSDAFLFHGNLNPDWLIRSFEHVAFRHEVLRTNFDFVGGKLQQKIKDAPAIKVRRQDLSGRSKSAALEEAKQRARREAIKPFDLKQDSLMRVSIFQVAEEDFFVVLTMHHIVFDKWSMGILLEEVAQNYVELSNGKTPQYEPLEIQYADYAYWQTKKKPNDKGLDYWKEKLDNSLNFLDLPADFRRPNRPSFRGGYQERSFPRKVSEKLREMCKSTNTTLYVLLLTAYKVLLHRYTNESDILVGSPVTSRDRLELENLIGFFNETVVLRSDLSGNPRFSELLESVKRTTQAALEHKDTPFETIVKSLGTSRYLSHNPLFQVMFIYHKTPNLPFFGDGIRLEHQPFDIGVAKFDLTLYISDKEEIISGIFEYAEDLFRKDTVEQMHDHLQKLVEAITENPHQRISDISLLTDKEIALLETWNETDTDLKERSVVPLFETQVKKNPKQIAVSFKNKNLTYGQLNHRSNLVANFLHESGLDRNRPIGILCESSLEMVIGIFGVLKAGFAYLPIDAQYPEDRIDSILKDSETPFVLSQQALAERIAGRPVQSKTIEEILASNKPLSSIVREKIEPEDLAYVIYTSGSTGEPKGVAVTHENLASSTLARFDFYPNKPESFLILSSFSFDSSMVGIFWTLSTGGKLVLTERLVEQDVERLQEIFEKENVTHTLMLPALYTATLGSISSEKLLSLQTVIVAGEPCPSSLADIHFKTLPNTKLYNEYGPTETTVWATADEIELAEGATSLPIGKPIANTKAYVLDKGLNRVPVGVAGELYIGGKGVAQGYFNKPKLTEERFLQNPFDRAGRLYRTGDVCRFRSDGKLEYLGRTDEQIKLRGYRIELGEIQETFRRIPNIRDVIVRLERLERNHNESDDEMSLSDSLAKMNNDEADKLMRSVEVLSDREILFMLNEMETS